MASPRRAEDALKLFLSELDFLSEPEVRDLLMVARTLGSDLSTPSGQRVLWKDAAALLKKTLGRF